MAHSLQAKKRIRQNIRRNERAKAQLSRIRTHVRKVEEAISAGDMTSAKDALRLAQPELHKGAAKGAMHRNTVDRKLSRISKRIKALG